MISIIVPVYNVEKYIHRCVKSICEQTWSDFELILVDDGSSDSSGKICDQLARTDNRIHVIHQKNKGLSVARNVGTMHAKGEYITYIDSDDSIAPKYLELLYFNAVSNQAQVSVCAYKAVRETDAFCIEEEHAYRTSVYTGREATFQIVSKNNRNMISAWGKLYHLGMKDKLIYPEGRIHEDEFVTYKVFYSAEKVVVSDAPYYLYTQRAESITNTTFSERRLDKLLALKEAVAFFEENKDVELREFAEKRYLLNIQIAWYRVYKYMKKKERLLETLYADWQYEYKKFYKEILCKSSLVDKISICVFRVSPKLYSVIAGIVLVLFPEI